MKLVWSPLALERIQEIGEYISIDNLNAAKKWVYSIFKSVERLKRFPESGRWVEELHRYDIREIIIGSYRVVYRLEKKQIAILTVRHLKQRLLFAETARARDIMVPDDPLHGLQ